MLQLMPSQTTLNRHLLMQRELETEKRKRAMQGGRRRGAMKVGGGSGCINIACAEPAEDAYPSVGAAVMYQ